MQNTTQIESDIQIGADRQARQTLVRLILALGGILILIVLALAILSTGDDPLATLSIFSTRFLGIFIEAAPFLLLGTLVSGLLEVFVSKEDIVRWVPRNPFLATITGIGMGFAFPVCECGVVPVTRRLFTKGLPMSAGVAFLLAAPVMNPIVLVSTYIAFGQIAPQIVIGRFVITAIVAGAVGLIFAYSARPQEVLRPVSLVPVRGGSPEAKSLVPQQPAFIPSLYRALRIGGDEFFDMGRFLVIGSLLAAAMQTLQFNLNGETRSIQDLLFTLGQGPVVSVIVMQVLAFILSVCSTVDSFLGLAFYGTFTGGSILAFLTFGPMIDIKSTLMFAGVFKKKALIYLIVLPFLMTLLIGVWVNLNLSF